EEDLSELAQLIRIRYSRHISIFQIDRVAERLVRVDEKFRADLNSRLSVIEPPELAQAIIRKLTATNIRLKYWN
ncbi:MAG: hypothetical protein AAB414_05695, partial [Patescibacteria group bacterium]